MYNVRGKGKKMRERNQCQKQKEEKAGQKIVYISDEEREKCRKVVNAFAEELDDIEITVVDAGRYGLTTPALISKAGAVLANFARILAGAVASSLEIAMAFGPSREPVRLSNSVPLKAKFINVFLYTL